MSEKSGRGGRVAIDSSAILVLIEGLPGADRVEEALELGSTIVPWPVVVEVHYVSTRRAGAAEADRRHALLSLAPAEVVWEADERLALSAARIKADHRLSFADALIGAYAIRHGATLLHRDPDFEGIEELSTEILPR